MTDPEKLQETIAKAERLYREATGYTPREHFHRTSDVLSTREERNKARRRYNKILQSLEEDV